MLKFGICPLLLAALLGSVSCRKESGTTAVSLPPPVVAADLSKNLMTEAPQGLLASRSDSPVHWQHWDPVVLEQAKDSRRLILAFIGSPHYLGCVEQLDAIDQDPSMVAKLNNEFIPVLVDVDLCREAAVAAAVLCQELRLPVGFPFLLVLSPEGNEVTWRPMHFTTSENVRESFEASVDVVTSMWEESSTYVTNNSAKDHENRLKRFVGPDVSPENPEQRSEFLVNAARQLVSLYDADIGKLDRTGGLLPVGVLQCLASASLDPEMPPRLADRCREAAAAFANHIQNSAMIDPLDGGVYSTRRDTDWSLPSSIRNCPTQARTARALVTLHSATQDPRTLEVALGAVAFAEKEYSTQNGLFANQRQPTTVSKTAGLWTSEQIENELTPKEAAVWIARCDISDLGNLTDSGGDFFRLNSLALLHPVKEAAEAAEVSEEEAAELFESGRKKLLKARQKQHPEPPPTRIASAASSFRMVSAYAALYTATDDASWKSKAVELAKKCRENFAKGDLLIEQNPPLPLSVCDARAFSYALAIQAALDLAEITLDDNWRIWAGDLATITAENFVTDEGMLLEARPETTLLKLPIEDRIMLFDDSTAGIMRMNLARLDALGQSPPPTIAPWLTSLPPIRNFPVVFTDSILATSFASSRIIIDLPENASSEWREAVSNLPLDRIARRIGNGENVTVTEADGSTSTLTEPSELQKFVSSAGL